ncbi:helix-turn-helix transcriptional regulator [Roseitalea porphyridii]|uniref:helix-turn-helix transcriptional regulator n=1 Tax=Roseitalea porphyridii TaxID=1852022 RepID=UPI0032EB8675
MFVPDISCAPPSKEAPMGKSSRRVSSAERKAEELSVALLVFIAYMKSNGRVDMTTIRSALRPVPKKRTRKRVPRTAHKPEDLLTPDQAARVLKQSPKTLAHKRSHGDGPRFIKLSNRAIRYRYKDLLEYAESGLRMSTSEPAGSELACQKNRATKRQAGSSSSLHSLSVVPNDPPKTRPKKRKPRNKQRNTGNR